jgi:hypothetical protein
MTALERSERLPAPTDFEALRWPVGVAWAREIGASQRALWLLYSFDGRTVTLEEIRATEPVHIGD